MIILRSVVGSSSDSARVIVDGNGNDTGEDVVSGLTLGSSGDVIQVIATNVTTFDHLTDAVMGTAGGTDTGVVTSFTNMTGLIELNQTGTDGDYTSAGDLAVTFDTAFSVGDFQAALQYNLTAGAAAATITTGSRADTITGGAGNDQITGGAGSDILSGGTGADTFVFAASSSGGTPSGTVFDTIRDYATQVDKIDFGSAVVTQFTDNNTSANSTTAGVSSAGVVSFDSTNTSLTQRLTAVANAIGNNTDKALLFGVGSDAYVFVNNDTSATVGSTDLLIKLEGITVTAGMSLDISSGGDIVGIIGGSGNDSVTLGSSDDYWIHKGTGGAGNDTVAGGSGRDFITFQQSVSSTAVNNGSNVMFAGAVTTATNGVYPEGSDSFTGTGVVNPGFASLFAPFSTTFAGVFKDANILQGSRTTTQNATYSSGTQGDDLMVASNQKDVFLYQVVTSNANNKPGADQIHSFKVGQDFIFVVEKKGDGTDSTGDHVFLGSSSAVSAVSASGTTAYLASGTSGEWIWTQTGNDSGTLAYDSANKSAGSSGVNADFTITFVGLQGVVTSVNDFFFQGPPGG